MAFYYIALQCKSIPKAHITITLLPDLNIEKNESVKHQLLERLKTVALMLPAHISLGDYKKFGLKEDIEVRICEFMDFDLKIKLDFIHKEFGVSDGARPKNDTPNYHITLKDENRSIVTREKYIELDGIFIKKIASKDAPLWEYNV